MDGQNRPSASGISDVRLRATAPAAAYPRRFNTRGRQGPEEKLDKRSALEATAASVAVMVRLRKKRGRLVYVQSGELNTSSEFAATCGVLGNEAGNAVA